MPYLYPIACSTSFSFSLSFWKLRNASKGRHLYLINLQSISAMKKEITTNKYVTQLLQSKNIILTGSPGKGLII
jgi:hypothetical protein